MTGLGYGAASVRQTTENTYIPYTEYSHREERRGACPVCGKKRTRRQTFTATTSPFNKDPETGLPRTPQQVVDALRATGAAWVPDFSCNTHAPEEVCAVVGHVRSPYERCKRCRADLRFIDATGGES